MSYRFSSRFNPIDWFRKRNVDTLYCSRRTYWCIKQNSAFRGIFQKWISFDQRFIIHKRKITQLTIKVNLLKFTSTLNPCGGISCGFILHIFMGGWKWDHCSICEGNFHSSSMFYSTRGALHFLVCAFFAPILISLSWMAIICQRDHYAASCTFGG
jgi:hypothetical protein